jgi:hypothetical protein
LKVFNLFLSSIFLILFSACSSKNSVLTPKNIEQIEENKSSLRKYKIKIANENNENFFKVYLSKENEIKYIFTSNVCNYTDKNSDVILMYKNSFYPDFSVNINDIQCGVGSMGGIFILSSEIDIKNYTKENEKLCKNRFTKLSSSQIFDRIATGIITLGTSILTSGNMHTIRFDSDNFKETIVDSNLDYYQEKLFVTLNRKKLKMGFDVLYLDNSNIEDILNDYYNNLIKSNYSRDGLIIIDKNSKQILTIIDFKNYSADDIIKNIFLQVDDVLNNLTIKEENFLIKEKDVLRWIPKEIVKPKIPELPILVKDEFETKKEFNQRVLESVKKREDEIKFLQKEYNLNILKRNEFILTLENSYNKYLENIYSVNNELQNELNANIEIFVKILFVQNLNGIYTKNFNYDAEKKRLYFEMNSKNGNIKNSFFANIPVSVAKNIKNADSFYIEPVLNYKKGFISLLGFNIVETKNEQKFKIIYSNINFIPISQKVVIQGYNEKIKDIVNNKKFIQYKQNSSSIIDDKKEFWYIDLVDTLNARVPKWFSQPQNDNLIISYASASSYEEAKLKALNDLAITKEAKISSVMEAKIEFDSRLKDYSNLNKNIRLKTEVKFKENDYKILNQEKIDGVWYISLMYTGN